MGKYVTLNDPDGDIIAHLLLFSATLVSAIYYVLFDRNKSVLKCIWWVYLGLQLATCTISNIVLNHYPKSRSWILANVLIIGPLTAAMCLPGIAMYIMITKSKQECKQLLLTWNRLNVFIISAVTSVLYLILIGVLPWTIKIAFMVVYLFIWLSITSFCWIKSYLIFTNYHENNAAMDPQDPCLQSNNSDSKYDFVNYSLAEGKKRFKFAATLAPIGLFVGIYGPS